jgi:hypothetical protein
LNLSYLILFHPFILAGQIATTYYFSHFLIILPISGIIDNVLGIIATSIPESYEDDDNVNYNHHPLNIKRF